ncbi:MAG TPA: bifunctional DNA-formamidopyrimidine glycosylase/DNA-(apurinic or apyrimidinic site) lyase [Candidatus Acidoferrum sp.]|jgi:formamidopyrimidine-DNA glycosylase
MPELPEVEAIARTLRPLVRERRIRCVHVFHSVLLRPQSVAECIRIAQGAKIKEVQRVGKYLFLRLDRGLIEMHFRFDGQLLLFANARELLARANAKKVGVHVDVAFELDKGVLGIVDQRHLGRVHVWNSEEECRPLKALGVDALSKDFTAEALYLKLSRYKRPLKDFLLDQTEFAGIGNIYSCEALWHARLDPCRRADSLERAEARKLHKAIVSVLRRALECCLEPSPDFRDPHWWFQGLERILRVYQRVGLPCRRCGEPVQRIKQWGRSTYCCLQCQI